jgi:hypothetical protein
MFGKVRPRKTGASSFPGFEIIIYLPPALRPSLHARFRNGNTIYCSGEEGKAERGFVCGRFTF